MNRGKKDWMMDLFRSRAQVLIATEAGGEGINLQFCHHMINFDLPWNPMRVEQRIGRVHRLGQNQDVQIYNLCTLGTIEEHIVSLLHEKINLFELVIGELDHILERFEKKETLEQRLARVLLESGDNRRSSSEQINDLGNSLLRSVKRLRSTVILRSGCYPSYAGCSRTNGGGEAMNEKQVHKFVQRYLESTGCHILEKSHAHFQVKLSPRADRELNQPSLLLELRGPDRHRTRDDVYAFRYG